MAAKSVYLAKVFKPGLADGKTLAFSSQVDCAAFAAAVSVIGKPNHWYRVETSVQPLYTASTALAALKAAWER